MFLLWVSGALSYDGVRRCGRGVLSRHILKNYVMYLIMWIFFWICWNNVRIDKHNDRYACPFFITVYRYHKLVNCKKMPKHTETSLMSPKQKKGLVFSLLLAELFNAASMLSSMFDKVTVLLQWTLFTIRHTCPYCNCGETKSMSRFVGNNCS